MATGYDLIEIVVSDFFTRNEEFIDNLMIDNSISRY
jgi:hypothetical protein